MNARRTFQLLSSRRCLLGLVLTGLAVIAPPTWSATLLEAYNDAKANDPVLGAAQAQLEANEEAVPQTRSLLLPTVSMNGSTSWNEREILNSGLPTQEYNDHSWGARFRQPLLNMESWFTHSSGARRSECGAVQLRLHRAAADRANRPGLPGRVAGRFAGGVIGPSRGSDATPARAGDPTLRRRPGCHHRRAGGAGRVRQRGRGERSGRG